MILTEKQEAALKIIKNRYGTKERYTCIAGYAGSGKALAANTRIPTPIGDRQLSTIEVGDYIYGADGAPTKVIGVFPQGITNCYRLYFEDGRYSDCNESHIWRVKKRGSLKWKDMTLKQLIDDGLRTSNNKPKYCIPVCGPVNEDLLKLLSRSAQFGRRDRMEDSNPDSDEPSLSLQYLYSSGLCATRDKNTNTVVFWKSKTLNIVNVQRLQDQETICLFVENKDHLFLTQDYIVTHNTTLTKYIPDTLGLNPDSICHIAYTGKAANVLMKKGNKNAMTAHKLLYRAVLDRKTGTYYYVPKPRLDNDYSLIIIDEVSMLPREMWIQLLTHNIPVIALGDPAQLMPVAPEADNGVLNRPHIFLDEVVRQAQENEIIRFSMFLRNGGNPRDYRSQQGGQIKIIEGKELTTGILKWADQILCATNATRIAINNKVRDMKGYPRDEPQIGDRIIGLSNHWEFLSNKQNALTNGAIGTLTSFKTLDITVPRLVSKSKIPVMFSTMQIDDGEIFQKIPIDYKSITQNAPSLTPIQLSRLKKVPGSIVPYDFAYAYAITTWKAQGSEWDKILGFEESFPKEPEPHQRYLYTLVTRARDKLVLVI